MPPKEQMDSYRSAITDELLADASVRKFIDDNKLDESFISKHLVLLLQMQEENRPCKECDGYLKCKKVPQGYSTTLVKNEYDDWELSYSKCSYHEDLAPLLSNYYYRDFTDSWLFNSLDQVSINAGKKKTISGCLNILSNDSKHGLYIQGKSGTGKTYLAVALCNDLIRVYNYRVAYVNVRNFIQDCVASFGSKEDYTAKQVDILQHIDVVVFDDIGAEKVTEWSIQNVLFSIIDYRSQANMLTLFTSMYSLADLQKLYGGNNPKSERIINRIMALADPVELRGIDLIRMSNK